MSCKTCLGKFFGILGSNIFFVALVAMVAAVFTQRWAVSSQRDVSVAGMPTNADLQFGIFDMSARVMQEGKVQWSQYSYTWCNAKETTDDGAPWTNERMYCNLLLTAQACSIISLATGLTAGVIAAFLSAGVIVNKRFREIACASSFFMLVQFTSALLTFACWFGINTKINNDLDKAFPGIFVRPSYSAFLAVICAGLVLLGFITTSALGGCGRTAARKVAEEEEESEDEEEGRAAHAPRQARDKKAKAGAPQPGAQRAAHAQAAGGEEMKESQ